MANVTFSSGLNESIGSNDSSVDPLKTFTYYQCCKNKVGFSDSLTESMGSSDTSTKIIEEDMEVRERVDQGKDIDALEDIYKDSDNSEEVEEEERGIVGDMFEGLKPWNIAMAVGEGASNAVTESIKALGGVQNYIEDKTNMGRFVWTDGIIPEWWSNEEVREANLKDSLYSSIQLVSETADAIPDADTVTGGLITGISQFATGFLLTRKATGVKGFKGSILNSAITDATFFDPYDENIANLLKGQGAILDNVFTQSLMSNENDSEFKARLKKAGEGAIIGAPLEALGRVFRSAKAIEDGKSELATTGKVSDATRKEMDASIDALENLDTSTGAKPSKETIKKT